MISSGNLGAREDVKHEISWELDLHDSRETWSESVLLSTGSWNLLLSSGDSGP